MTGGCPARRDSNAENVSIWWRHNDSTGNRVCQTWWPLLGILSWYPILESCLCNSFENEIYRWLIFNWLLPNNAYICVWKLTIIGSDNGLLAQSHYLNQWWNIVNSNLRNEIQWNLKQNLFKKMHLKISSGNDGHFVSASMCLMRCKYLTTWQGTRTVSAVMMSGCKMV